MNWLALVPKRLLLELLGGALSALAIWALWQYGQHWKASYAQAQSSLQRLEQAEQAYAKQHQLELQAGQGQRQTELATIRSHVAAGSGPVPRKLRSCATSLPAGSAANTAPGAAPAGIQPVPATDSGLGSGPDRDGTDMRRRLVGACDGISAELREQQRVH